MLYVINYRVGPFDGRRVVEAKTEEDALLNNKIWVKKAFCGILPSESHEIETNSNTKPTNIE